MSVPTQRGVPAERLKAVLSAEEALYAQRNPRSAALAKEGAKHWLRGVPMHWMVDWPTPFPLAIKEAKGVTLTDADGNSYVDFCLGDTGAMFGHAPPAVVEALQRQAARGLTTMLPSEDAAVVGRLLSDHFGLPIWQVTATASDANRSVIRWARAATKREQAHRHQRLLSRRGRRHLRDAPERQAPQPPWPRR